MPRYYSVISADGHLEIPSEPMLRWVPERYRDRAPKLVKLETGGEAWAIEGMPLLQNGPNINGGAAESTPPVFKYRGMSYWDEHGKPRPGTGSARQRLQEQDAEGVDAEVLFPPVFAARFLRGIHEKKVYLMMVQAYNNFLAQEYCSVAPDRLIGSAVVPGSGVDDAVAEMERVRKLGLRAVTLDMWPNGGLGPKPDDDRFWSAAQDSDVRVCSHLNFGSLGPPNVDLAAGRIPGEEAADLFNFKGVPPTYTIGVLVTTGVFTRFPKLKLYFAETNGGWIPYWFQSLNASFLRAKHWFKLDLGGLPSDIIRRHCRFSIVSDYIAVRMRHDIGIDIMMWGSDLPHLAGSYPATKEILKKMFRGVPEAEKRKILLETPAGFFGLDLKRELTPTP